ncbi:MAG: tetratricopeptide repeat protein [Lentisphaerae bacterium]|nr:tetratricopeptide repeat protein [Lentisphaerota bacterium]
MRIGALCGLMCLALVCGLLAGCQVIPRPAQQAGSEASLSQGQLDMADAIAHYSLGLLREGLADPGALTNYLQALQLQPERLDLYARAAAVHLRLGASAEAVAVLQNACRRNPRSAEACLYLAQVYQALQQWSLAEDACRQAARIAPEYFKIYLQLAALAQEQGDQEGALTILEEALALVADKRPLLRLLGDLHLQRTGYRVLADGALPEVQLAIDYYERAAREPPDALSITYLRQLGDLYMLTRQFAAAAACYGAVLTEHPAEIATRKKLALCHLALGERQPAIAELQAIAEQEPANLEVQCYLGELYEEQADIPKAIAHFISACAHEAASAKPFLKLARLYLETDPRKASQVLESGLKQIPEDQQLLEMLIPLYLHNQQKDAAQTALYRLQAVVRQHHAPALAARLLFYYALAAQHNDLPENAAAMYQEAIELDPYLIAARLRLAFLYLAQARRPEALQIIGGVEELLPEDFHVLYFLGLFYFRLEYFPQARAYFEQASEAALLEGLDGFDLDSSFYFAYGAACERCGEWAAAELLLEHAIRLDPENGAAFNYLAYMWAERGQNLMRALFYIDQALDLEPENGAFLDTLGWVYFQLGRYTAALDEIHNALVFMPQEPIIMEHMGDVLWALQRVPEAFFWWREAYRLNPQAAELGAKLKTHAGQSDNPPAPDGYAPEP